MRFGALRSALFAVPAQVPFKLAKWASAPARVLFVLFCLSGLGGCASSYTTQAPVNAPSETSLAPQSRWAPLFLVGLFGKAQLEVRESCESGVADDVRIGASWSTTLVTLATFGIFSPLEIRWTCAPLPADEDQP